MKPLDLTGLRSGRLAVLRRVGSSRQGVLWACRCDCGNEMVTLGSAINAGRARSCGCLSAEAAARMGAANKRHGMTRTTEYNIWLSMRARCGNPKATNYHLYGARGIAVCERWADSFDAFYADMGPRPPGMSIDRVDGAKGYSPDNCRWATLEEQARNKKVTHRIEWDGEIYTLKALADKLGIPECTVHTRIRAGASLHQALTMKPHRGRPRKALEFTETVDA